MIKQYTTINLIKRILSEFRYPQTKLMRGFREILFSNYKTKLHEGTKNINFIYDLNHESPTFDFAYAALQIDKYSEKNNLTFRVIFIKRKRKDYKKWYPLSVLQLNKRIKDMLIPLSDSFRNCYETVVLDDLNEIKKYKRDIFFSYNFSKRISYFCYKILFQYVKKSNEYKGIKVENLFLENIKKDIFNLCDPLDINKIITITLRSYDFEKERDSDLDFWYEVAEYYRKLSYQVFIIPDSDNIDDKNHRKKFFEFIFLNECSKIMNNRIAIYEIAKLNFFPHSGTAAAAQLNKKSSSITHLKTNPNINNLTATYFNEMGQTVGKSYDFLTKSHIIYWNGDVRGIIEEANKLINS
ncbi:hypothetical protein OAB63_00195 [Alphaproteobacteria bacterium]|nr:hypothetical protein [Alphaproteobacteria bacterium]